MAVNWGKELGIDIEELKKEHPLHPQQLRMKRILNQRARRYWENDRQLAQLSGLSGLSIEEYENTPKPKEPRKKRASSKLRRYEFTEAQLEIARRSLNGHNSV